MKNLLKLEELGLFIGGCYIFSTLDYPWYYMVILFLLPDISMLGYLLNPKFGSWCYNLFHHRLIAIIILLIGYNQDSQILLLIGSVLFSHIAFDRIFGYGLKFEDSFSSTHLGKIGKNAHS